MRQTEARRERRRRIALVGTVTVVVLAVIGGLVAIAVSTRRSSSSASGPVAGVQTFPEERGHTTAKVTYPQSPPAGGAHSPMWLTCGIYASPVPNENAVHDLEHGAVWITYRPDLASAEISALQALVREQGGYTTLSPYSGLRTAVTASAWGAQLNLDSAGDPRLRQFLTRYRQSAQAPEPGATCDGGVGTPSG